MPHTNSLIHAPKVEDNTEGLRCDKVILVADTAAAAIAIYPALVSTHGA